MAALAYAALNAIKACATSIDANGSLLATLYWFMHPAHMPWNPAGTIWGMLAPISEQHTSVPEDLCLAMRDSHRSEQIGGLNSEHWVHVEALRAAIGDNPEWPGHYHSDAVCKLHDDKHPRIATAATALL